MVRKLKRKVYRLRRAGEEGSSIEVTVPKQVLIREAEKAGLSIDEFLKQYSAVALFDGPDGVLYRFEPLKLEEELPEGGWNDYR